MLAITETTNGSLSRLLELDPDLAEVLPPTRREQALATVLVETITVPAGIWKPAKEPSDRPLMGLLVIEGIAVRQVGIDVRLSAELVGPGDLLRPWPSAGPWRLPASQWRVLWPLRLAVLDAQAGERLARYPELFAKVATRGIERVQRLAAQAAVARFVKVEDRLLHLLWGLSERWGRVVPDGIWVDLPLTHEQLGLLIGARRPTVTTALGRLAARRRIIPRPDRGWLLCGDPPTDGAG